MKTKIVAIAGPTASGKTALSIELARMLDGEIISCDSMQIYKYMNIGTAKPTEEEMAGIPHHLIDFSSRKKLPIFCGGTGLYLDNVLNNTVFSDSGKDDEIRENLEKELEQHGPIALHAKLADIDPESALKIHPNNKKRVAKMFQVL